MFEFIISIVSTIAGGLLLTLILFLLNEYAFRKKNFTGEWNIETITEETEFKEYKNMKLYYRFHILQKGYEIFGSGEKIKEIVADGTKTTYQKRGEVEIHGYYDRKYLGKSKIYLSIIEEGVIRGYRTFYILKIVNENELLGNFSSTAANSRGVVKQSRNFLQKSHSSVAPTRSKHSRYF